MNKTLYLKTFTKWVAEHILYATGLRYTFVLSPYLPAPYSGPQQQLQPLHQRDPAQMPSYSSLWPYPDLVPPPCSNGQENGTLTQDRGLDLLPESNRKQIRTQDIPFKTYLLSAPKPTLRHFQCTRYGFQHKKSHSIKLYLKFFCKWFLFK